MKKLAALLLMSCSVMAAPKDELNQRLQQTEGFSADFTQQVTSPDGDVVMEGEGKLKSLAQACSVGQRQHLMKTSLCLMAKHCGTTARSLSR